MVKEYRYGYFLVSDWILESSRQYFERLRANGITGKMVYSGACALEKRRDRTAPRNFFDRSFLVSVSNFILLRPFRNPFVDASSLQLYFLVSKICLNYNQQLTRPRVSNFILAIQMM